MALRLLLVVPHMVEFRERAASGRWRLDVLLDGAAFGHVDADGGLYRYFEGPSNEITWSFADLELERLKARIRALVVTSTC